MKTPLAGLNNLILLDQVKGHCVPETLPEAQYTQVFELIQQLI